MGVIAFFLATCLILYKDRWVAKIASKFQNLIYSLNCEMIICLPFITICTFYNVSTLCAQKHQNKQMKKTFSIQVVWGSCHVFFSDSIKDLIICVVPVPHIWRASPSGTDVFFTSGTHNNDPIINTSKVTLKKHYVTWCDVSSAHLRRQRFSVKALIV